jgi:hypothetical protein
MCTEKESDLGFLKTTLKRNMNKSSVNVYSSRPSVKKNIGESFQVGARATFDVYEDTGQSKDKIFVETVRLPKNHPSVRRVQQGSSGESQNKLTVLHPRKFKMEHSCCFTS